MFLWRTALLTAWRTHHVAYVANRNPRSGSYLSTAHTRPTTPSATRSARDAPCPSRSTDEAIVADARRARCARRATETTSRMFDNTKVSRAALASASSLWTSCAPPASPSSRATAAYTSTGVGPSRRRRRRRRALGSVSMVASEDTSYASPNAGAESSSSSSSDAAPSRAHFRVFVTVLGSATEEPATARRKRSMAASIS
mmetsp:Transcript_19449/g.77448  ORF Transcript_19449/g.77448 Transcript_19449/m.77448 type:complete len:200 (+) Transcript_19449:268-867(+)